MVSLNNQTWNTLQGSLEQLSVQLEEFGRRNH